MIVDSLYRGVPVINLVNNDFLAYLSVRETNISEF